MSNDPPTDVAPLDYDSLNNAPGAPAPPTRPTTYQFINMWLAMALFAGAGLAFMLVSIAGLATTGVLAHHGEFPSRSMTAGSVGLCVLALAISLYLFIAAGRCDRAIRRMRKQRRTA